MRSRYWIPAYCDICGEPGETDDRGNVAQWTGGRVVHRDPSHCRDVLARKAKELKEWASKCPVPAL